MDGETANTEEKTQTETEAEPAKEEKEPEEVAQKEGNGEKQQEQQPEQQALDQKQQQQEVGSIPEKATVETSDTAETGTGMAEKSEPSNPENASSEREAADVAGIANESGVEEEKDLSNAHCSICQSGDATEENDVLLCDGPECNRAYHQLCHFAPIFVIPRGNWYCLICRYSRAPLSPKKRGRPPKSPRPASAAAQGTPLPRHLSCLHPPYDPTCPPTKSSTIESSSSSSSSSSLSIIDGERQLENILAPLKTSLIYSSLQSLRSTLASSLNNIRAHENTIRTYTASGRAQRDIIQYGPSSELLHAHAKLVKAKKKIRSHLLGLKGFIYGKRKNEPRFDDDDTEVKTGIHASQISCVVCLSSDSTDENDILLCDGKKCFRAFHMACMEPRVHPEDLNNAEPWFCPYCTAYANLIHFVQQAYMGDEKLDTEWEDAEDVFEGEVDITPEELKKKIMGGGEDLSSEDEDYDPEMMDVEEAEEEAEGEEGEEENEKKEEGDDQDEADNDDSDGSLQDMSDVEVGIEQEELEALNDGEMIMEEGEKRKRVLVGSDQMDMGKLDKANILSSKRSRQQVDYRKLNESMFGNLSLSKTAALDDDDDFDHGSPSDDESDSDDENPKKKKKYGKRGRPRKYPLQADGSARKRGRPKKTLAPGDDSSPLRKRGRPRKNPTSSPPAIPSTPSTSYVSTPVSSGKKKRGRPRKTPVSVSSTENGSDAAAASTPSDTQHLQPSLLSGSTPSSTPRKRGRPRKNSSTTPTPQKRASPSNTTLESSSPKKKRGRPKREPLNELPQAQTVPETMPALAPLVPGFVPIAPRPLPPSPASINGTTLELESPSPPKKKRGRPKKSPAPATATAAAPLPQSQPPSSSEPKKRGRPRKNPVAGAEAGPAPATITSSPSENAAPKKRGRPKKDATDTTKDEDENEATKADPDPELDDLDQEINAVEQSLDVTAGVV